MATHKLRAVEPAKVGKKRLKFMLYGREKVGKTWASLDFPNCYYIDVEGGANFDHYLEKLTSSGGRYMGQEHGSLDFDIVLEEVKALATQEHPFQNLVIDSISKLYNTAIANEADRLGEKNVFSADKKPAIAKMRKLINWISRLDMNVILIGQEREEWGLSASGERVQIGRTYDCWEKLGYELDLSINIYKAGPGRMAKVILSRLTEFPENTIFPWMYQEFCSRGGKDILEKKSQAIVLSSPEQLAEIKSLLDRVKLPDGQVDKWLNSAKVDSWEEMSSDMISRAIAHINKTYINVLPGA